MDTRVAHTAAKESWDDFFEFQLGSSAHPLLCPPQPQPGLGPEVVEPEPGPSAPTRIPAAVENWDDDFAEDDDDDDDADLEAPEQGHRAGPNPSSSTSISNVAHGVLVSPRSFRSLRDVEGEFDEGSSDDDEESWDEEDEEEEESWDEDDEEAQERAPPAPASIQIPVHTPVEGLDALLSSASPLALSLSSPPLPPPPSSSSSSALPPPPETPTPAPASAPAPLPSTSASTSTFIPTPVSSLVTPEAGHHEHASLSSVLLPPPSGAPSLLLPLPLPLPLPVPPLPPNEFGAKIHRSDADDDDDAEEEEHGEMEDEDATITARSRQRRPGARHAHARGPSGSGSGSARSVVVPPVPPVPPTPLPALAVASAPTHPQACFAPPAAAPALVPAPAATPAPPVSRQDVDVEDRGEGPSARRAPVFSPPGAARPRTADGLSSRRGGADMGPAVERERGAGPGAGAGVGGAPRARAGGLQAGGSKDAGGAGGAGLFRRIGDGVSRWASSSNGSSRDGASGTADGRSRGRGRANTVTGASVGEPPSPAQVRARPGSAQASGVVVPRASLASSVRPSISSGRPSTSSARPSTSTSSARPSTSSSARPSTASSASPSSRSFARPRPTAPTAGQNQNQNHSQRNSIVSLLSMRTYRSRTSSVSMSWSGSGSSRRTSALNSDADADADGVAQDEADEAPPRASISSWTQRLFSGADARARQSVDEVRARQSADLSSYANARQRQSLDVRPGLRHGLGEVPAATTAISMSTTASPAAAAPAGAETRGVLGFFGARRKRSNTVSAAGTAQDGVRGDGKEKEEEVYANKKASKSQRSLHVLLGRKSSLLARRASRKDAGGQETVAAGPKEGVEAEAEMAEADELRVEVGSGAVFSPPPRLAAVSASEAGAGAVPESMAQFVPRGVKRRIPSGRASLPLIVQAPSSFEAQAGGKPLALDADGGHVQVRIQTTERAVLHRPTQSQSSSRSTSNSNSLSSIGELRIPSRISQAQVSIRRDLGLVKEFAGKVAELKDLQGSYLKMIESVQGMVDSDTGQALAAVAVKPSRPRSNTSPALSRPPSRSPLAALFQGPDQSVNVTPENTSPSPVTPATPSTPSSTLYSSADLAQRMADITARYDSWWECAELLIELGNTPPSMPTPVSTVRLVPTLTIAAPPPSPAPPPPSPAATVTARSRGDTFGAPSPGASAAPAPSPSTSPSNHAELTLKPSRGRANTFAGNMPVARLRSASTSTASIPHAAPDRLLSPSASSTSSAPSHTWRATTGRHDLSQRQLVLLRQMLGVDQRQRPSAAVAATIRTAESVDDDDDGLDESDEESDVEDATWRWGHANTVQLPSPAEEKEAYFGVSGRKKKQHSRPWSRPYHQDIAQSEYEDQGLAVYVTPAPAPEPLETKKSKGMNAIRDMLRTLKRAHPPTPISSTLPTSVEAPPSFAPAPRMSVESPNGRDSPAPNKHAIRRAASLLPLSSAASSARVSSSSSTVSRASKIDPTLAFAMTPDNIKPLLDNAREVSARLGACVANVQALLASAGVDAVPVAAG